MPLIKYGFSVIGAVDNTLPTYFETDREIFPGEYILTEGNTFLIQQVAINLTQFSQADLTPKYMLLVQSVDYQSFQNAWAEPPKEFIDNVPTEWGFAFSASSE